MRNYKKVEMERSARSKNRLKLARNRWPFGIVLVISGMAAIDQDGLARDLNQNAVTELGAAHVEEVIERPGCAACLRLARHENPRNALAAVHAAPSIF
jgi:hypothetical protein